MSVRMKTKSNSRRGRAARTVNGGRRGSMVAPSALCLTTWHARGPRQMDTAWRQRLRDVAPARSVSLTTDGGRRQPRIIHHKQTTGNFSFLPFYFSSLLSSPPYPPLPFFFTYCRDFPPSAREGDVSNNVLAGQSLGCADVSCSPGTRRLVTCSLWQHGHL